MRVSLGGFVLMAVREIFVWKELILALFLFAVGGFKEPGKYH